MRETKKNRKMRGNERGITLIALVITIIILLILAGVTISMLAGENGILGKAKLAAQKQESANIQDLTIAGYYYELIAATQDFRYLNMEKTAQGIYSNLTSNGYKMRDINGEEITSAENLLSENKELISLNVKGKHGDYKGEVTKTGLTEDIKIVNSSNNDEPVNPGPQEPIEPTTFDWNRVNLTVDTNAIYRFYDSNFGKTSIMNFTTDGKLIVKVDETTIGTYDATDNNNINSDGNLTIPFTYAGNTYDTTLTMNGENIDAELKGFATVTYIKEFDWSRVNLTIDTSAIYRFYDSNFGKTYIINFTTDGKLIVKADETMIGTYDAKDNNNINVDGNIMIPFTYAGTTYDTTLTMNGENINAELKGFTTVIYTKVKEEPKTYPIAYSYNGTVIIIEISENQVLHRFYGGISSIKETDDIKTIEGQENVTVINSIGKSYSKVIVTNSNSIPAVYCEDDDKWYLVTGSGSDYSGRTLEINYGMTATKDTTTSKEELEQIIQDET